MNENIRGVIIIGILLACVGGCIYYFSEKYECVKITIDGSVHCDCEFDTKDEWNKFKDNTRGEHSDGWEPVGFPNGYDPCKVIKTAQQNIKNAFGNNTDGSISTSSGNYKSQDELQRRIDTDYANFIIDTPVKQNTIDNNSIHSKEPNEIPNPPSLNGIVALNKDFTPNDNLIGTLNWFTDENKYYKIELHIRDSNSVNVSMLYGDNNPNKNTIGDIVIKDYKGFVNDKNEIVLIKNGKSQPNLLRLVNGTLLVFNDGAYKQFSQK